MITKKQRNLLIILIVSITVIIEFLIVFFTNWLSSDQMSNSDMSGIGIILGSILMLCAFAIAIVLGKNIKEPPAERKPLRS